MWLNFQQIEKLQVKASTVALMVVTAQNTTTVVMSCVSYTRRAILAILGLYVCGIANANAANVVHASEPGVRFRITNASAPYRGNLICAGWSAAGTEVAGREANRRLSPLGRKCQDLSWISQKTTDIQRVSGVAKCEKPYRRELGKL